MGVVYEAHDPLLDRAVALKTILLAFSVTPEEREAFERRFFAEARIAAGLRHPAIVVVHDVGRDEATGTLFIAFEHLQGRTLAEVARAGPLPWREALRIAREAALGLQHAHAQGVVHRDIKPANIMLLASGETKIMDFGIAKVPAAHLTAAGHVFGTPANMSPEQAHGETVDARSDLFSLGTVLYQLLTGRRAFAGDDLAQILDQVEHRDPEPPSRVVAGIPEAVDELVARLLAKQKAVRYASARELAEDAEDILAGRPPRHRSGSAPTLVSAATDTAAAASAPTLDLTPPPARRAPARRAPARGPLLLTALAALALVGVAVLLARWREPLPPPARLVIDFQHPLREGDFRLWLDDELVIDADLSGRVTKHILGLKLRGGTVEQILEVAPGSHQVRVRVAWGDNVREETSRARLEPGAVRQLEIRLGRLLKDLSLEWK
jgi:serine/threonine-protein kinase